MCFRQLIENCLFKKIKKKSTFVYFKGGPIGKFLKQNHIVFLIVEPTPDDPLHGLCGMARVENLGIGSPEIIWSEWKDKNPIFSQEQYHRFCSIKNTIIS